MVLGVGVKLMGESMLVPERVGSTSLKEYYRSICELLKLYDTTRYFA